VDLSDQSIDGLVSLVEDLQERVTELEDERETKDDRIDTLTARLSQ
jgi:uncharacterized protein YlxW (UPF0749 family)